MHVAAFAFVLSNNFSRKKYSADAAFLDSVAQGTTDTLHRNTTIIDQGREARESAGAGMQIATAHMLENFDIALTRFEGDVRDGKANVRVVNRNTGRSGGGSMTLAMVFALALVALVRKSQEKKLATKRT